MRTLLGGVRENLFSMSVSFVKWSAEGEVFLLTAFPCLLSFTQSLDLQPLHDWCPSQPAQSAPARSTLPHHGSQPLEREQQRPGTLSLTVHPSWPHRSDYWVPFQSHWPKRPSLPAIHLLSRLRLHSTNTPMPKRLPCITMTRRRPAISSSSTESERSRPSSSPTMSTGAMGPKKSTTILLVILSTRVS
jgi:hypothetical protein